MPATKVEIDLEGLLALRIYCRNSSRKLTEYTAELLRERARLLLELPHVREAVDRELARLRTKRDQKIQRGSPNVDGIRRRP